MPAPRKSLPMGLVRGGVQFEEQGRERGVGLGTVEGAGEHPEVADSRTVGPDGAGAAGWFVGQVATPAPAGTTLAELLLAYLDHAERHHRNHDGTPTSEIYEVRVIIRALRELSADTPVAEFGPLCVKAARQRWVNEHRSRTECNRRVALIKRIFKWAVSEELAPPAVYQAVATSRLGRRLGRREHPVGSVVDAIRTPGLWKSCENQVSNLGESG